MLRLRLSEILWNTETNGCSVTETLMVRSVKNDCLDVPESDLASWDIEAEYGQEGEGEIGTTNHPGSMLYYLQGDNHGITLEGSF